MVKTILLSGLVGLLIGYFIGVVLEHWIFKKPGKPDGSIGIEGGAMSLKLNLAVAELLARKEITLKVDIPDAEELLNSQDLQGE